MFWHTFRQTVGTLLAEMGASADDPRLLPLQQQAASSTRPKAQEKLVEAILPVRLRVTTIAEVEVKAVAP